VPPGIWRIHGRDYDMTSFVDKHPGGPLLIMLGKGTDCTILFETYHVFNEPRKRLRTHDVTPDGLKPEVPPCPSAFLSDVRTMVKEHFKGKPKGSHKASTGQLCRMAVLWLIEVAAIWYWIAYFSPIGGVVAGVTGYLLMVNLGHDSSHGALTRSPRINTFGQFIGNSPFVTGHASWSIQHLVSHHQHTNEVGQDVDAHHFPFARWHRETVPEILGGAWCGGAHNLFWHMITWLAATLSMSIIHPAHFILQPLLAQACCGGLPSGFDGGLESATMPRHGLLGCPQPKFDSAYEKVAGTFARERVLLHNKWWLFGNVFVMLLSAALAVGPVIHKASGAGPDASDYSTLECTLSWLWVVALGFIPFATSSICFMTATQISHIQESCQVDSTLREQDPYKKQALTSLDHSSSSVIGHFITGGLNLQSVHHCLPSISLVHYPALYPKFYEVCKKHDCVPVNAGGLHNAIAWHLSYVYKLGKGNIAAIEPTLSPTNCALDGKGRLLANKLKKSEQGECDEKASPIAVEDVPAPPLGA